MALGALLLAFALDRWFGEPPARWHPVVWMGRWLDWSGQRVAPLAGTPAPSNRGLLVAGALAWLLGAAAVLALVVGVQALLHPAPGWIALVAGGVLLKPLFAWRMLVEEVAAVELALTGSLPAGRARLARLVSRDVAQLDAAGVRESAIESLAENLNDSVVAPVFWFVLLGLPGAALYRYANTADAMWGYRGERGGRVWDWTGKFAARVDDGMSWLPARITAVLIAGAAAFALPDSARDRSAPAWRRLPAEARRTPSPNSGWPMAAMALALGVRLAKPGAYTLNAGARTPAPADSQRAQALASRAVILLLLLACAILAGTA